MQVKGAWHHLFGRPDIEVAPSIGASFKYLGLGWSVIGVALEEMTKEWQLNLFAIKLPGLGVEINFSQLVRFLGSPVAMCPGPHDQKIGDACILPFGPTIGFQRAKQILGIVPPAHRHHRAVNVLEMRTDVARLP